MANEKKSDFVVSDRRKFTTEGELKPDAPVEESQPEETQLPRENVVEMKRPEEATTSGNLRVRSSLPLQVRRKSPSRRMPTRLRPRISMRAFRRSWTREVRDVALRTSR